MNRLLTLCALLFVVLLSALPQTALGEDKAPVPGASEVEAKLDKPWAGVPWPADGTHRLTRGNWVAGMASGCAGCAIGLDGQLQCWGGAEERPEVFAPANLPSGKFKSVSISPDATNACALDTSHKVVCWGNNAAAYSSSTDSFVHVSVGDSHSCGVTSLGTVTCAGRDDYGQSSPPSGKFSSVSVGESHTCGLRPSGEVVCWGRSRHPTFDEEGDAHDFGVTSPPPGQFSSLSVDGDAACGTLVDGTIKCWGALCSWSDEQERLICDETRLPSQVAGSFSQVSAMWGWCGLKRSGFVQCDSRPRKGRYRFISGACGVKESGEVDCWGECGADSLPKGLRVAPAYRPPAPPPPPPPPSPAELWRAQVIKSVQTNPRIAYCYERMLAQQPGLSGTLALTVSVGADGRTEKIVLNSDTLGSDKVQQCVALMIRSLSLPAPNTSTSFSVTLDFSPNE